MIDVLIELGIPVLLLILGLTAGKITERRHFKRLADRESRLRHLLVTDLRNFPARDPSRPATQMFVAEAVIATDYLKTFLASLKNIIGGELRSLESLVVRARKEAMLRMLEQAHQAGFDAVCNLRVDTADISGTKTAARKGVPFVGVMVSGTAYHAVTAAHG
jgi:uncharacterized protein YbjQ (UPF0145 family)